jgi:hypothetical protein
VGPRRAADGPRLPGSGAAGSRTGMPVLRGATSLRPVIRSVRRLGIHDLSSPSLRIMRPGGTARIQNRNCLSFDGERVVGDARSD